MQEFVKRDPSLAGATTFDAPQPMNVIANGEVEPAKVMRVAGNFYGLLGTGAAAGRIIEPGDEREGVAVLGYGYWAVEEKASGRFAGDVGFADFHRMIEPSIRGVPEAGWVLAPDFHGRGYASEAVAAALQWLDQHRRGRSVSIIDPANLPSLKLAARNGFREYARTVMMGEKVILLERE